MQQDPRFLHHSEAERKHIFITSAVKSGIPEVALQDMQLCSNSIRDASIHPHATKQRPLMQQVLQALLSCSRTASNSF